MRRACTLIVLLLSACVARPADDLDSDAQPTGDETASDETAVSGTANDDTAGDDTTMPPATTGTTAADVSTSPPTATAEPPELSHAIDIQPIFDEHCVEGCHEPDGEWGFFLDLRPGTSYDGIVGVPTPQMPALVIIEPGNPDGSYLWHKINGTQVEAGGSGLTMPKARLDMEPSVLTLEQLGTIEQWIVEGAAP